MAANVVGALAGLFLVGLALYQFKNKVLLTGRGGMGRGIDRDTTPVLVYVFSTVELAAGIGMLVLVAVNVVRSAGHVATCNERESRLECTDYLQGSSREAAAESCEVALSAEECPTDSLYGRCAISEGESEREVFFYNSIVLREGGLPFAPTLADRTRECEQRGGTWQDH